MEQRGTLEFIGTAEIPANLRRVFFVVPTAFFWSTLIIWTASTAIAFMWIDGVNSDLGCTSRCGLSWGISPIFGIAPCFVWIRIGFAVMKPKARFVSNLIADELGLDNQFRMLMTKRLLQGWSMGFKSHVPKRLREFRLIDRKRNISLKEIRSYRWIVSVSPDLSTMSVSRASEDYEMEQDLKTEDELRMRSRYDLGGFGTPKQTAQRNRRASRSK